MILAPRIGQRVRDRGNLGTRSTPQSRGRDRWGSDRGAVRAPETRRGEEQMNDRHKDMVLAALRSAIAAIESGDGNAALERVSWYADELTPLGCAGEDNVFPTAEMAERSFEVQCEYAGDDGRWDTNTDALEWGIRFPVAKAALRLSGQYSDDGDPISELVVQAWGGCPIHGEDC